MSNFPKEDFLESLPGAEAARFLSSPWVRKETAAGGATPLRRTAGVPALEEAWMMFSSNIRAWRKIKYFLYYIYIICVYILNVDDVLQ